MVNFACEKIQIFHWRVTNNIVKKKQILWTCITDPRDGQNAQYYHWICVFVAVYPLVEQKIQVSCYFREKFKKKFVGFYFFYHFFIKKFFFLKSFSVEINNFSGTLSNCKLFQILIFKMAPF